GSTHPSGVIYTAADWSCDWNDLPVFPMPFVFDDRVASAPFTRYEPPDRIFKSERHRELFRLIRHLKGLDSTLSLTRYAVSVVNKNCCEPPLTEDDDFEAWFQRAWDLRDRPRPVARYVEPAAELFTANALFAARFLTSPYVID